MGVGTSFKALVRSVCLFIVCHIVGSFLTSVFLMGSGEKSTVRTLSSESPGYSRSEMVKLFCGGRDESPFYHPTHCGQSDAHRCGGSLIWWHIETGGRKSWDQRLFPEKEDMDPERSSVVNNSAAAEIDPKNSCEQIGEPNMQFRKAKYGTMWRKQIRCARFGLICVIQSEHDARLA